MRSRRALILLAVVLLAGCAPSAPETSRGDPVGTWGTVAERSAYLVIDADGSLGGHDGCNGFGGSWEQSAAEDPIVFADVYMTLMACDFGDQWLTAGRSALVDGDRIVVFDEDGEVLGSLPRTA
ncbi:META domain-containing protein [Microbacterium invictum]|uniref:DUF306 domain-containing protein n=1 Tax=Microbacterium invictum TaxID=515415 RepID=A0AA40SL59_9MICO|nr:MULTISPECIES: META domain-containing protein [Microbacterium]MBB4138217.1 hypothetical protein [Microbacterium invictum]